jgi:hypothetical protein
MSSEAKMDTSSPAPAAAAAAAPAVIMPTLAPPERRKNTAFTEGFCSLPRHLQEKVVLYV